MSNSTLALTGAIASYYATHAFREPAILKELRAETASKARGSAGMQIAPEQGAFMGMIASLMDAREILEIGTFTGYSSLAMALASKANITAVDVSAEWTAIARSAWARAGVASRITLRLDGGVAAIAGLLKQGMAGSFDLCFIDADKPAYDAYYEGALKLLRVGGLVMIDNVLWDGAVADPRQTDPDTAVLRALNARILADARVEMVLVPIGDGLTLARKKG
jgi:predicted O-methyltransferase YrrM